MDRDIKARIDSINNVNLGVNGNELLKRAITDYYNRFINIGNDYSKYKKQIEYIFNTNNPSGTSSIGGITRHIHISTYYSYVYHLCYGDVHVATDMINKINSIILDSMTLIELSVILIKSDYELEEIVHKVMVKLQHEVTTYISYGKTFNK